MSELQRPNRRARKELLRTQAQQRQAEHDALTPDQKLQVLVGRPGESARELARLGLSLAPPVKRSRPRRRVRRS